MNSRQQSHSTYDLNIVLGGKSLQIIKAIQRCWINLIFNTECFEVSVWVQKLLLVSQCKSSSIFSRSVYFRMIKQWRMRSIQWLFSCAPLLVSAVVKSVTSSCKIFFHMGSAEKQKNYIYMWIRMLVLVSFSPNITCKHFEGGVEHKGVQVNFIIMNKRRFESPSAFVWYAWWFGFTLLTFFS